MNRLCAAAALVGTIFLFSLVLIPLANALPTVSVSPSSWTLDVGQSKTFTATASGGSGSYSSYQWYVGGVSQSGATASTFSYSPASSGSPLITVTVTDTLGATSAQSTAPSVTVHSALVAPTASASKSTVDQGQTSILTSTAVSTGTSPYSYQWFSEAPGAGSYSLISSATSSSYSFVTSGSTTIGSWSFELQVTDSASTPVVVVSSAVFVLVNSGPTDSITPSSWTLDVGQSKTFTATASGGSGSYSSYAWYVDSTLQSGQTAATFSYSTGSSGSHSITATVTDNLGATSPQSTVVSVTVNSALVPPSVSASLGTVDQGQTSSLTSTAVSTGTSPNGYGECCSDCKCVAFYVDYGHWSE
ncbi:MAG: PKD domain-containing protein [Candidatus Bathyarchaeia archaeon]